MKRLQVTPPWHVHEVALIFWFLMNNPVTLRLKPLITSWFSVDLSAYMSAFFADRAALVLVFPHVSQMHPT
jgi:hypothetical protein